VRNLNAPGARPSIGSEFEERGVQRAAPQVLEGFSRPAAGAAQTPKSMHGPPYIRAFDAWFFGPAGNRRFGGFGRPRRPGTPFQKVGPVATHLLETPQHQWFPVGPAKHVLINLVFTIGELVHLQVGSGLSCASGPGHDIDEWVFPVGCLTRPWCWCYV
jgi:hypothetical protein